MVRISDLVENPRALIDAAMTEAELQRQVIDLAEALGWLVYHTYNSRRSQRGFPDLCLVKGTRLMFVELKREKGKLSAYQQEWLRAIDDAKRVDWRIVRPSSFDTLADDLKQL